MKYTLNFEAGLGWLILIILIPLHFSGVVDWSWWFLAAPFITTYLGEWGILRVKLLLTPFGSIGYSAAGIRSYVSYYVFGIRIVHLHLDRA